MASVIEHGSMQTSHPPRLQASDRRTPAPITITETRATSTFTGLQTPLQVGRAPIADRMSPTNTDASTTERGSFQFVLERTEDGWRATEHRTEIEGTGHNAARAAEDYCRRVAEHVEAPEPGQPTEGSA